MGVINCVMYADTVSDHNVLYLCRMQSGGSGDQV